MKRFNLEVSVGVFLVLGFLCFAWLAVKLGDVRLFGDRSYQVSARFGSISGLKPGAAVEIAGVKVGRVNRIVLDQEYYEAVVELAIDRGVRLTEDSIASIRTAGIIGDRYINISPGGSPEYIEPGGRIHETESAINLEELLSRYIFESK
ncbi:outer membrane lipid asymmetry maintenance protein MlaD [Geoalkalibacter halelectricus]|uniref:Outer membrane lipid asymmetry maintenance protein MlaD n=1 Tax=Geoalkalibacter halelectricus TaxID=2847045 RepID=A0ABY5ZP61_9BACT|nr:outer membrane lipid asymmetry maintenance protein MlaD [Geoalkalibacter halelectricus]MDO3379177.1 outer membrane lipid asymmetry maintenance protein MlaD [Geoalkalibacter halelectricus]UWZ80937.1 outer membrane lipid asymmetry maintenance protein MlaD [Geoalkalibacter halelectricus]